MLARDFLIACEKEWKYLDVCGSISGAIRYRARALIWDQLSSVSDTIITMDHLTSHNIILRNDDLVLRPLAESDRDILLRWNTDPEVLYYSNTGDSDNYTIEDIRMIYCGASQTAFTFIIEYKDKPIGECWLQKMNLARIVEKLPNEDLRRIDLMIGEKELWAQGIGTRVIGLLTEFGFENERADAIFGCSIADYNPRSRRIFEKNGYTLFLETVVPPGEKARVLYDLICRRMWNKNI